MDIENSALRINNRFTYSGYTVIFQLRFIAMPSKFFDNFVGDAKPLDITSKNEPRVIDVLRHYLLVSQDYAPKTSKLTIANNVADTLIKMFEGCPNLSHKRNISAKITWHVDKIGKFVKSPNITAASTERSNYKNYLNELFPVKKIKRMKRQTSPLL